MVLGFSERKKSFSSSFFTQKFYVNLHFQSVLICLVLNAENITKMSHTHQWFY